MQTMGMPSSTSRSRNAQGSAQVDAQPGAVAAERVRVAVGARIARVAAAQGCPTIRPIRSTNPIRPGPKRHEVERAQPHADHQIRGRGSDRGNRLAQETRPVLKAAAITPWPIHGAQELMPQIAMAVLDVHEGEAGALSQSRGSREVIYQPGDIAVAHQGVVGRNAELAVEPGVVVEDCGLKLCPIRPGKPAGMGELQANQQVRRWTTAPRVRQRAPRATPSAPRGWPH